MIDDDTFVSTGVCGFMRMTKSVEVGRTKVQDVAGSGEVPCQDLEAAFWSNCGKSRKTFPYFAFTSRKEALKIESGGYPREK